MADLVIKPSEHKALVKQIKKLLAEQTPEAGTALTVLAMVVKELGTLMSADDEHVALRWLIKIYEAMEDLS